MAYAEDASLGKCVNRGGSAAHQQSVSDYPDTMAFLRMLRVRSNDVLSKDAFQTAGFICYDNEYGVVKPTNPRELNGPAPLSRDPSRNATYGTKL